MNFFTPCLLFSKVAFSLSSGASVPLLASLLLTFTDKLRELWVIPIFFALVSGVSLVVAWLLGSLFRLDRPHRYASIDLYPFDSPQLFASHRNFAMAAAMIMNSNSLPVALLQSLVFTVPGLQWYRDETLDEVAARAITYLLLCGTMGQFVSSSPFCCVVTHPMTIAASLELWGSSTCQSCSYRRGRVHFTVTRRDWPNKCGHWRTRKPAPWRPLWGL